MVKPLKYLPIFLISLILLCAFGCGSKHDRILSQNENTLFLGDSVLTIISSDRPNGYTISILKNKDLCLWHFQRGDSIDRYLALHRLPFHLEAPLCDSIGVFKHDFDIQVLDTLSEDIYSNPFFFMDVNFDREAEFVVAHQGYNRIYYACSDLVNGNRHEPCIGFLSPMDEKPYNNIVGGMCGKTDFDFRNQVIHIFENTGSMSYEEIWAKPIKTEYETTPRIRIFKKIENDIYANGVEHIIEYSLVNDTLKEISHKVEPLK